MMESPTSPSDRSAESAAKWNRELAGRVTRWKRFRLTFAILLTGVGVGTVFFEAASIWSVPCFIAAFVAYLLYLDSRDQLREVKARQWTSITPRISRITARSPKDATAARPSS